MPLSATAFIEKNKLSTQSAWIVLIKVTLIDSTVIRICQNSEDVTWPVSGGTSFTRFPFEINEIGETMKGEIPSVGIKVSNVGRVFEPYLDAYDGMVDSDVKIYVVNALNVTTVSQGAGVNNPDPEIELDYEIIDSHTDSEWVTFSVGASNIFSKSFPRSKVARNFCRYKDFKGDRCQHVGVQTTCDRTLNTCKNTMTNSIHFGGFPGVDSKDEYI
jgi:lambda family phage minor tail protein L